MTMQVRTPTLDLLPTSKNGYETVQENRRKGLVVYRKTLPYMYARMTNLTNQYEIA